MCGLYYLLSRLKIVVMQTEMPIAEKTKETQSRPDSPAELYFLIEHFFLFVLWFVHVYVSVWMYVLCVVCICAPVHGACLCTDMWGPEELLNVVLYCSLPIPLRQGLSLYLGLTPCYSGSQKVRVIALSSLRVGATGQGRDIGLLYKCWDLNSSLQSAVIFNCSAISPGYL